MIDRVQEVVQLSEDFKERNQLNLGIRSLLCTAVDLRFWGWPVYSAKCCASFYWLPNDGFALWLLRNGWQVRLPLRVAFRCALTLAVHIECALLPQFDDRPMYYSKRLWTAMQHSE